MTTHTDKPDDLPPLLEPDYGENGLHWHALNYRTAHTQHADAAWQELERFHLAYGAECTRQAVLADRERCNALQEMIDALMLEYCPDEMTQDQLTEWSNRQVAVSPKRREQADKSARARKLVDETPVAAIRAENMAVVNAIRGKR